MYVCTVWTTEYTECWPCLLFDILLKSIILLASPVAARKLRCTAGADKQGMYSTIPIHWNIKSSQPRQKSCWASSLCMYLASWVWSIFTVYSLYHRVHKVLNKYFPAG